MVKETTEVKPYLRRIRKWKIRNMVMLYLEAREQFFRYSKMLRKGNDLSFEKMREIGEILFEIKEDHHLIYRRLLDPQKQKFEKAQKFTPDDVEINFMNNVGLLFHKVMVVRELKYVMEHYVEQSAIFRRNRAILHNHLKIINNLFDEGVDILKSFIKQNNDNIMLMTLLIENPVLAKKHFTKSPSALITEFSTKPLDEIYSIVGDYYLKCGHAEKAKEMFKSALKRNSTNEAARDALANLN